jgi:hypothetical protein
MGKCEAGGSPGEVNVSDTVSDTMSDTMSDTVSDTIICQPQSFIGV